MDALAPESDRGASIVDCASYAAGRRIADLELDQIRAALTREDAFVWLGLYEPDEALLRRVQQQFGLHDLAVEDAYKAHQRPKLELYENAMFVVLRTAQLTSGPRHLDFGETHIFVGRNYVVTVRHGSVRSLHGVRQHCESAPQLLAKGPGYVLYALMDFVVDQYLPIVQQIEDAGEELENLVLENTRSTESTPQIYHLKRELLTLRRAIYPLMEVCNRLMRFDLPHLPDDTRPYFRDVHDHIVRLVEAIDTQRELLTTALEAHLTLVSVAQNEHMRRMTAWAAMIAVPTMIAGIYGMNFPNIPELHWHYGYYASLAVMALGCLGLYIGFRRSGWL